MRNALTAIAGGAALSSCTMIHNEVGNSEVVHRARDAYGDAKSGDPEKVAAVPATRSEILDLLGPPAKIGTLGDDRYAFAYEYRNVKERQIGFNIPQFSILKFSVGKADAGRHAMLIEFSRDDRVLSVGSATWDEDVGYGANVQLFFSVAPTVKTGPLRERLSADAWATDLLLGPVGMVDLSHDPDAGDSGLRFSGMPKPDLQWPASRTGRK